MVTHEDIQQRLESGQLRFQQVEDVLAEVRTGLAKVITGQDEIRATIKPISDDITDIKEMVGAWKAVAAAGKFAKWVGGIASGLVAAWVIFKVAAKAAMGL